MGVLNVMGKGSEIYFASAKGDLPPDATASGTINVDIKFTSVVSEVYACIQGWDLHFDNIGRTFNNARLNINSVHPLAGTETEDGSSDSWRAEVEYYLKYDSTPQDDPYSGYVNILFIGKEPEN